MTRYVLSLDQGTTSSRAILFADDGGPVAVAQQEFPQIYPKPGWVEHNPEDIWSTQLAVAREALTKAGAVARDVAAIGVTNQRETTIIWDRKTGEPVCNAIVWQCRRTAPMCDALKAGGFDQVLREKTGLVTDAYFSGTKVAWILENVPSARERAERGELAFGTVDTFLLWRLSGGRLHVTDVSNASRTLLFNIRLLDWDDEILAHLKIPRSLLPELRASSAVYGESDPAIFGAAIPLAGDAGDQQAATASSRDTRHPSPVTYCLEGSVFVAGAAVQWLRDGLGIIPSSAGVEALARSVADNGGVYFVPAFVGLGAPYWDSYARGTIVGLTRGATAAHIARAALESIAFQTRDVLEAMERDAGLKLQTLRVDGGAAVNDLLMQFQADLLGVPVQRPKVSE
ncbi:MAG: glycerol kinase, partial [Chloroflexi bacterium]|nr:glycerol kinase [Chloroflexota bacterium]